MKDRRKKTNEKRPRNQKGNHLTYIGADGKEKIACWGRGHQPQIKVQHPAE